MSEVPVRKYYAGGQWREAAGGAVFEDYEPYTGEVFARVADGGAAEARIAIEAAAEAFPAWAALAPAEKAKLFYRAAEIVRRRSKEIAEILARETGSTIPFSTFQQEGVAATLEQAANWVFLPKGEVLQSNVPNTHSVGVRRPLGVVASFLRGTVPTSCRGGPCSTRSPQATPSSSNRRSSRPYPPD